MPSYTVSDEPYVTSELTGKSCTRNYVERFLDDYNELSALMLGGPYPPVAQCYIFRSRDSTKLYIGRAGRITDGYNPFEDTFCARLDIGHEIRQLDERSREVLGRRYVNGEDYDVIGEALGLSADRVKKLRSAAIKQISDHLDGIYELS